jgi:uncharacterized membrane protein YgdD (TMEM256/DUF423 family)
MRRNAFGGQDMSRPSHPGARWPVVAGALLAGVAVALAAHGAHGADPAARINLLTAAAFAFGHGVALLALVGISRGRLATLASLMLLLGTLLFCGALVAKSLFGLSSAPAPFGGGLLMLGWLLHAIAAARR